MQKSRPTSRPSSTPTSTHFGLQHPRRGTSSGSTSAPRSATEALFSPKPTTPLASRSGDVVNEEPVFTKEFVLQQLAHFFPEKKIDDLTMTLLNKGDAKVLCRLYRGLLDASNAVGIEMMEEADKTEERLRTKIKQIKRSAKADLMPLVEENKTLKREIQTLKDQKAVIEGRKATTIDQNLALLKTVKDLKTKMHEAQQEVAALKISLTAQFKLTQRATHQLVPLEKEIETLKASVSDLKAVVKQKDGANSALQGLLQGMKRDYNKLEEDFMSRQFGADELIAKQLASTKAILGALSGQEVLYPQVNKDYTTEICEEINALKAQIEQLSHQPEKEEESEVQEEQLTTEDNGRFSGGLIGALFG